MNKQKLIMELAKSNLTIREADEVFKAVNYYEENKSKIVEDKKYLNKLMKNYEKNYKSN